MGKLVLRTAAEHVRLNRDHGRIGADKLIETSEQRQVDRDKLIEQVDKRQVDRDKRIETAGGDSGGRRRRTRRRMWSKKLKPHKVATICLGREKNMPEIALNHLLTHHSSC